MDQAGDSDGALRLRSLRGLGWRLLSEAIPSLEIQGYFDFEGIWDAELTPASNDQNQAIA